MTTFLPDVNVLIALLDPKHPHANRARDWFKQEGRYHWLTCPTTQNGVIRIMCNPAYSLDRATPLSIMLSLESLMVIGNHELAADDVTLLDAELVDSTRLLGSKQVTDTYLLANAVHHNAQLATFDSRLVSDAVKDGRKHLYLIP